jgi:hypothetical protein
VRQLTVCYRKTVGFESRFAALLRVRHLIS